MWPNKDPLMDYGSPGFDFLPKRITHRFYMTRQRQSNAYLFVLNAPTIMVDAFGLQPWMPPGATPIPNNAPPGMPGLNRSPSSSGCPDCPPGQNPTPYWQVMGYESAGDCATQEWSLYRDTIAGILGSVLGDILGGGYGGTVGFGAGEALIPTAICNQTICQ
jgi:hypothetical protein